MTTASTLVRALAVVLPLVIFILGLSSNLAQVPALRAAPSSPSAHYLALPAASTAGVELYALSIAVGSANDSPVPDTARLCLLSSRLSLRPSLFIATDPILLHLSHIPWSAHPISDIPPPSSQPL